MLYDSRIFCSWLNHKNIVIKNQNKYMTMAMSANKKFWTEFIDIYHSLPSLWNTADDNYSNRESRSIAWNKLVEKMREVEPDANQATVKRKINTFRSNFNREVRKIRLTKTELPTDLYTPTLWYFELLSFLLNQEKSNGTKDYDDELTLLGLNDRRGIIKNERMCKKSIYQGKRQKNDKTAICEEPMENNSLFLNRNNDHCGRIAEKEEVFIDISKHESRLPLQESIKIPKVVSLQQNYSSRFETAEKSLDSRNASCDRMVRLKKFKSRLEPYSAHEMKSNLLSSIFTDEASIYGQAWACGFRKLSPQQKLFAKKAIDEILILGKLRSLKLNMIPMEDHALKETSSDS